MTCDSPHAKSAVFAQFESAFGQIPGGGATQYLARLMGRARALEVLLSAQDYDAELAEQYGWINRALPANTLGRVCASARQADRPKPGGRLARDQGPCQRHYPGSHRRLRCAVLISSAKRSATPRRNGESKPPCAAACRPDGAEMEFATILDDLAT